jgi:hypothetical protein
MCPSTRSWQAEYSRSGSKRQQPQNTPIQQAVRDKANNLPYFWHITLTLRWKTKPATKEKGHANSVDRQDFQISTNEVCSFSLYNMIGQSEYFYQKYALLGGLFRGRPYDTLPTELNPLILVGCWAFVRVFIPLVATKNKYAQGHAMNNCFLLRVLVLISASGDVTTLNNRAPASKCY